jgi:hypothetical protein
MMAYLKALARSKEGLSNADLDDALNDNSAWLTLWETKQLTSLGFIQFTVDFFGNPARYTLTELGRAALSAITGQPSPPKPAAPTATPAPMPKSV